MSGSLFKNVIQNVPTGDLSVEAESFGTLYYTSFSILAEVFSRNSYLSAALESFDNTVSETTQSAVEFSQASFESMVDMLPGEVALEEEEKGFFGKAWAKIKAFFKAIGDWFAKQWGKFKGLFSKNKESKKETKNVADEIKKHANSSTVVLTFDLDVAIKATEDALTQLENVAATESKAMANKAGKNPAINKLAAENEKTYKGAVELYKSQIALLKKVKSQSVKKNGKDTLTADQYSALIDSTTAGEEKLKAVLETLSKQSSAADKLAGIKPDSPDDAKTMMGIGKRIAAGLKAIPSLIGNTVKSYKAQVEISFAVMSDSVKDTAKNALNAVSKANPKSWLKIKYTNA